jgi:predicted  nucleic acid-binding Zn-ribbon protein
MQISAIKSKINDRSYVQSVTMELDRANRNLNEQLVESNAIEEKLSAKRIKLAQSESSLYSGKIQNPKELQDLQTEISSLKKAVSILEDSQIEYWEKIEILTTVKSEINDKLEKVKAEDFLALQRMESEISQLEVEQQRLLLERKGVTSQLSPAFLTIYDKLLINKNGIAVSEIVDECCGSCGTTLTPSDCQHAKNHMIIQLCPNCGRILYAG